MVKNQQKFFMPPVFLGDEDQTRTVRVLYALLANFLVAVALMVIGTIFVFAQKTGNSIEAFSLLGLTLVCYGLARTRHRRVS